MFDCCSHAVYGIGSIIMDLRKYYIDRITFVLRVVLIASFILSYYPVWKRLVLSWYSSD